MDSLNLVSLYRRWVVESEWIRSSFVAALYEDDVLRESDRVSRLPAEMCLIRLFDAWTRFSRELVIVSAACMPYTATGIRLQRASGISKRCEVIPRLIQMYPKRRYEPNWGQARECIDAAWRLGVSNSHAISMALGSTTSPANDLRVVRNYFAHRSENAAEEIRKLPWFKAGIDLCVEELAGRRVLGGLTAFEDWVFDLRLVAEVAIQ